MADPHRENRHARILEDQLLQAMKQAIALICESAKLL